MTTPLAPLALPDAPDLAVVAPLPMELAPFQRSLTDVRKVQREGRSWTVGRLKESAVLTAVLGDGRRRAAASLEMLFHAFSPRRILLIGVAGGLDPTLEIGRVVVGAQILDGEGSTPPPDPEWLAAAVEAGLPAADVVSVEHIVASVEEKTHLWHRLGGRRPAVVDLESAALAHAATAAGVPYLVLRAVSDGADDALPAVIPRSRRADGSVNTLGVALRALLSPTAIPHLVRLQRQVSRCAETLTATASTVCRSTKLAETRNL